MCCMSRAHTSVCWRIFAGQEFRVECVFPKNLYLAPCALNMMFATTAQWRLSPRSSLTEAPTMWHRLQVSSEQFLQLGYLMRSSCVSTEPPDSEHD